ncbi:MAG: MBL fold metallo-hydrolase, partial [Candidatus Aminicenantaceae bacterium]
MCLKTKVSAATILLCLFAISAQGGEDLPLHQKKLSERVLVVWAGDAMQMIKTVALATRRGLVVIETSLIRAYDKRIRAAIEKEFGRNDFKYLINTHYHHDHTAGNQIYADATVIGHKNLPAGMREELTGEGLVKLIDKFKGMKGARQEELGKLDPGTREYTFTKEFLICLDLAIEELGSGLVPTYPSIVFEKNLV